LTAHGARKTSGTARKRAKNKAPHSSRASNNLASRHDRRHAGDRRSDQRSTFERDRDRVLYSSAFRRLAGVTQVVHAAEGHIFHNRLTHTLKVAQVGYRLADHLLNSEPPDLIEAVGGIDPSVVETAGLAHDLGHPPFGHIAEEELDKALDERGVPDGYEGNAQSFRIVTKVSIKSPDYPGLNLTRASLNAILKYPWRRNVAGKEHKKWGYYYSEADDFHFARELMTSSDKRQSTEAALMDWADDVTYSVHDVDDFYRAGLIPLDRLLQDTDERDRFIENVYAGWEKDEKKKGNIETLPPDESKKVFSGVLGEVVDELLVPFRGTYNQRAELNFLSSLLIRRYVLGPHEGVKAVSLVDQTGEDFIRIESKLRVEVDLLKELMRYYVFENPALLAQQFGQRCVIKQLFDILFEAADPSPKNKNRGLIPPPFSDSLKEIVGTSEQAERGRARLVADLIASMTEQQALLLHQRLMGLAPGSVRDLIIR
jgi:dGTPase